MTTIVAYIPFIDPIHAVSDWWYLLLIPLAFGISAVYKAMRVGDLRQYWRQVFAMTGQIVIAMVILAFMVVLLVEWLIPRLPVR